MDGSALGHFIDFGVATVELQVVKAPLTTEVGESDALVAAARAGDRGAFGLLYGRYARMVHGILLCRVPPREVDDLVQEVFLTAMKKLSSLREDAKFGGWLATITRNRATDYFRKTGPENSVTEEVEEEHAETAATDHGAEQEAAMILEVVRGLPEAYREPLILRLVEGMTGPEIAERTGLTHGSVRVNLFRGMQLLREKLAEKASGKAQGHG